MIIPGNIIVDIIDERGRQESLGYVAGTDDQHSIETWGGILVRQLGLAMPAVTSLTPTAEDLARFRRQMVRIAATALAAIESCERRKPADKVADETERGRGY